ncbi:hypothetical protein FGG08_002900 [Glutinoglossum americanum]|uniref:FAD dependent oxidoreductase domain-containing protein n=1 Tax=Glutinoglossum americanum TaxID=1670608 RepID=A0A9P8IED1_9PEZI|nr:hypothetical protein FGG08_002900 [Glutinoglossum americanum]
MTAYYLTRHPKYDPRLHSIILLEGTRIAGAASGKAGGFLATWAYPSCIVPLSFSLHEQLAREHKGDQRWGYRRLRCAQLAASGRDPPKESTSNADNEGDRITLGKRDTAPRRPSEGSESNRLPADLDWLMPETVDRYEDVSDVDCTAQVQPYLFTTCMAKLAEERGVKIILGTVEDINYKEEDDDDAEDGVSAAHPRKTTPPGRSYSGRVATSVTYRDSASAATLTLPASTIILAAGPWTPTLFPWAPISALRAHSITIKLRKPLSPYCIFTEISYRSKTNNNPGNDKHANDDDGPTSPSSQTNQTNHHSRPKPIHPEILTRPNNEVYLCGSGDYTIPLPPTASQITISPHHTAELITAAASISNDLGEGTVTSKRACYLPTVVVPVAGRGGGLPLVGETGVEGLVLAAGHGCWGIMNAPATGVIISEIVFDGGARSADVGELDPRRVL